MLPLAVERCVDMLLPDELLISCRLEAPLGPPVYGTYDCELLLAVGVDCG